MSFKEVWRDYVNEVLIEYDQLSDRDSAKEVVPYGKTKGGCCPVCHAYCATRGVVDNFCYNCGQRLKPAPPAISFKENGNEH